MLPTLATFVATDIGSSDPESGSEIVVKLSFNKVVTSKFDYCISIEIT